MYCLRNKNGQPLSGAKRFDITCFRQLIYSSFSSSQSNCDVTSFQSDMVTNGRTNQQTDQPTDRPT
jgi:hypothetical protein